MSTKRVSGLGKLGLRVAAATANRRRNQKAMQGVIARCSDVVPPGTKTLSVEEAQYYLGLQIEHEIDSVRERDNAHVEGLVSVRHRRRGRDTAIVEVYGTMLRTRQTYETMHGEGTGIDLLGLDTTVPDDPVRLHQMADRCRSWLRDPRRPQPKADLPGFTFDAEALAAGLDGPVNRLGESLEALPEKEKHTVDTLVSKLTAMRELDLLIGRVARWVEALYDLAGMEDESDRVRLSSHRSGSETASPQAGPSEDDSASQESTSEQQASE